MGAPDQVDLVRLQERNEGLNLVISEKDQRIEELNKHIEDINPFANFYKTKELKQIEAPGAKKPWWRFW